MTARLKDQKAPNPDPNLKCPACSSPMLWVASKWKTLEGAFWQCEAQFGEGHMVRYEIETRLDQPANGRLDQNTQTEGTKWEELV